MSEYAIDVVTLAGRVASVDFSIRRDTVEIRLDGRNAAVLDRELLRAWLACPRTTLDVDDVVWEPSSRGEVALSITSAGSWTLAPHIVDGLRDRI